MNFMQFLKSLDELLYEAMSWLIFYPITLWRAVRHPRDMMDYADTEQTDQAEQQYLDVLSPPMFLLVTLLIAHGVELAMIGDSALVKRTDGLAGLITDDTNLIIFRMIAFAIFPLVMAANLVRWQKIGLDRNTLKLPFYSQCYVTAPFALVFSLGGTLITWRLGWAPEIVIGPIGLTIVWYLAVQAGWFADNLRISKWKGLGLALWAYVECIIILFAALSLA